MANKKFKPVSHEELHQHVNPHTHHSEVPKKLYQIEKKFAKEDTLKSRLRLDWLYTKLKIRNFYLFPITTIVLLALGLIPIVLGVLNVPLPMSIANLPFLKGILEFLGIYNDKDLFVISTWVYWWPIFIATIFIFKRLWCGGFCPFGLTTDIGNFFGRKLRKGKQPKPINIIKYVFIGFIVFKALGYLHDAIGITNSAVLTFEFVVFFIVYALIIGMIAPRRTFCRVFCFLGSLPHLFGRLSVYTLETDRSKCATCTGKWCIRGSTAEPTGIATTKKPQVNLDGCPMFINVPQLSHTESNRNCILCGNCIKNCPYGAIHYKPKIPGYELYKGIDLNMHETVFILGLLPLLIMFTAMEGGLLAKYATFFNFPINWHWAITGTFYAITIIIFLALYAIITALGAITLNVNYKLAFRNFGYIFLPFAYMVMIRDITLTYFLKGSFIPVKFPIVELSYPFIDYFFVLVGATWSIYMAYRITRVTLEQGKQEQNGSKNLVNSLFHTVLVLGLAGYWIVLMLPEYTGMLSERNISVLAPFVFSAVIIGGFIISFILVPKIQNMHEKSKNA